MNPKVELYINYQYQKIKPIKKTDKGEIWLVSDRSDNLFILREMFSTGLPYKFLKFNPHPIFPKVIYCAEEDEETVVVEEFIQGVNLRDRLKREEYLTQDEAKSIILQLCDGLALLHDNNIIHRDITPANLILQGDSIKLIDFDIARTYKEGQAEDTQRLGTKGYAPPEQYGFGQTDARSDIYTLGLTMRQLLGDNYSGFLKAILSKCTEVDINKRYHSVYELKYAIVNQQQTSAKPQRLYKTIGLLAAVTTFGIAAYFYSNQEDKSEISESKPVQIEKPVEQSQNQNKVKAEKDDEPKNAEKFKFPDIVMPDISSEQQTQTPLPSTPKFELPPLPKQKTFDKPQTPSETEQKSPPQGDNIETGYVKVEYYANGERLNDWVDRFDYDINNAGAGQYIKSTLWKKWQSGDNSLHLPSSLLNLQVRVINYSKEPFYNPQLEVTYNGSDRKLLTGRTIRAGEEISFNIPLDNINIYDARLGKNDVEYSVVMNFSGNGAEIRGTATYYDLIFLKWNEDLPKFGQ